MLSVPKQVSFEHRSAVTTPAIPLPDITYEASTTAASSTTATSSTALVTGTVGSNNGNGHSSRSESGKANGGFTKVQEDGNGQERQEGEVSVEQLLEWCHSSLSDAVFDVDYNGTYILYIVHALSMCTWAYARCYIQSCNIMYTYHIHAINIAILTNVSLYTHV